MTTATHTTHTTLSDRIKAFLAEAESIGRAQIYAMLTRFRLPQEVIVRLMRLWSLTWEVPGAIIEIGRIILLKLCAFIADNSGLAAGTALGIALAALVEGIPLLGPVLSPIVAVLGCSVFGVIGHRLDRHRQGKLGGTLSTAAQVYLSLIGDIARELQRSFESSHAD